jgi:hypothetical protein
MACLASVTVAAGDLTSVEVRDGRVRASFAGTPIMEAVAALVEADGATVIGGVAGGPATVTATFDDVTLDEALERLLVTQSFLLVYRADGRLRRIHLLGPRVAMDPTQTPVLVRSGDEPAQTAPGGIMGLEVGLPPDGPLAQRLGRSSATLQDLAHLATRDENGAVRREAVDRAMELVDDNPRVQSAVHVFLASADDREVAGQVRSAAGPWAMEVVRRALERTRNPETRRRLAALVRALRDEG